MERPVLFLTRLYDRLQAAFESPRHRRILSMGLVTAFVGALAQKHRPLSDDAKDRERFVAAKKVIALALIATLVVLAVRSGWGLVTELRPTSFFEAFYTVLIFADVLVVLISIRYSTNYHAVFRNSGLAVATVLLRLALASPPPWTSGLGVAAIVFAIALTTAYERFMPVLTRAGGEGPA
jgi:hypothetical protein